MEFYTHETKRELVVILPFERWRFIIDIIIDYAKNHPKSKKAKELREELLKLPVF